MSIALSAPAAPHRFPHLRWAALAWLAVFVPAWASTYGAWHFLMLCNLGVLLTCAALWLDKPVLLSAQAVAAPGIAVLWIVDAAWRLATGTHLHGGTAYMWDGTIPGVVRFLSLYHLAWPAVLLWCLHRTGHDRRGLPLQVAIAAVAFAIGVWLAPAAENLNYVIAAPGGAPHPQPAWRALSNLVILAGLIYVPTEAVLRKLFPPPARSP